VVYESGGSSVMKVNVNGGSYTDGTVATLVENQAYQIQAVDVKTGWNFSE
jgi:hypothetical protein